MENIYKAYTREIDGKTFYFVKKFSTFPEIENCPGILESMGMHTSFYKACRIARISDKEIVNSLMSDVHLVPDSARIIRLGKTRSVSHSLLKNAHHPFFKLKWASIN